MTQLTLDALWLEAIAARIAAQDWRLSRSYVEQGRHLVAGQVFGAPKHKAQGKAGRYGDYDAKS